MKLENFENIPFSVGLLDTVYPDHHAIVAKAKRLEEQGKIIRLKRGLYVVSASESHRRLNEFLIANHIYNPSYISRQSALRYYGLIPERVYEITSMTMKHTKSYTNALGNFSYLHCPLEYYIVGLRTEREDNVNFLIASPEKALCDLIIYTPNINLRYKTEIVRYFEEDLRFDMNRLKELRTDIIEECMKKGRKKKMIAKLINLIEDER